MISFLSPRGPLCRKLGLALEITKKMELNLLLRLTADEKNSSFK